MKKDGLITNGFWMFKNECVELCGKSKLVQVLKDNKNIDSRFVNSETDSTCKSNISIVFNAALNNTEELTEIEHTGQITHDICLLLKQTTKDGHEKKFGINKDYYALVSKYTLKSNPEYVYGPIHVFKGSELIGLIMPLRV